MSPNASAFGALGLTADDFGDGEEVQIWPDTLAAYNAFVALSTQWRTGFSGLTGLDYNAIPTTLRLIGIPRKEWPELFEDLRVMEDETLRVLSERADK